MKCIDFLFSRIGSCRTNNATDDKKVTLKR